MSRLILDDLLALTRRHIAEVLARCAACPCPAPWPLAVDATAGNGNDTELLARHVGPDGLVIAFDVQEEALEHTRARLEKQELLGRVRLVKASHAAAAEHIPANCELCAVMFNLGFLPGSESRLTTQAESSLRALHALAPLVAVGGLLSVHCYTGQENGQDEAEAVGEWMKNLPWQDWRVARYEFCNKPKNIEVLYLAQKLAPVK